MILIETISQHCWIIATNTEGTLVARQCTKCIDYLSISNFDKNKNFKNGYNSVCKVCDSKRKKKEYTENPDKARQRSKIYRQKNPEASRESSRKSYLKNIDHHKQVAKEWRINNPAKAAFSPMKRQRRLGEANILGDNKLACKQMDDIYKLVKKLNYTSTKIYEIDHIIPLQHSDICGLHVPANLQILERFDNRRKSNQFDRTYENKSWRKDNE